MTIKEGVEILYDKVDFQRRKNSWWIFNKRNIDLSITRILEPYEKKANFPLPEKIRLNDICIDKNGIKYKDDQIDWSEICVTGISTEKSKNSYEKFNYLEKLLICFHDGQTLEFDLGDTSKYRNLLGHFIELYKINHQNNTLDDPKI